MVILYVILIVLASAILGLIVLVQNPKGGGLAGNIAGFSNQFMGVKQTTDVLEKGTWIFAAVIGVLCLFSTFFIPKSSSGVEDKTNQIGTSAPSSGSQTPSNTLTLPSNQNPAKPDSNKK